MRAGPGQGASTRPEPAGQGRHGAVVPDFRHHLRSPCPILITGRYPRPRSRLIPSPDRSRPRGRAIRAALSKPGLTDIMSYEGAIRCAPRRGDVLRRSPATEIRPIRVGHGSDRGFRFQRGIREHLAAGLRRPSTGPVHAPPLRPVLHRDHRGPTARAQTPTTPGAVGRPTPMPLGDWTIRALSDGTVPQDLDALLTATSMSGGDAPPDGIRGRPRRGVDRRRSAEGPNPDRFRRCRVGRAIRGPATGAKLPDPSNAAPAAMRSSRPTRPPERPVSMQRRQGDDVRGRRDDPPGGVATPHPDHRPGRRAPCRTAGSRHRPPAGKGRRRRLVACRPYGDRARIPDR